MKTVNLVTEKTLAVAKKLHASGLSYEEVGGIMKLPKGYASRACRAKNVEDFYATKRRENEIFRSKEKAKRAESPFKQRMSVARLRGLKGEFSSVIPKFVNKGSKTVELASPLVSKARITNRDLAEMLERVINHLEKRTWKDRLFGR